ncbi:MAG: DUF1854 domain-containing protein [Clostridia bacterium]|nr:DUF1854 domain-containing protein [Clostridia bacterium]
MPRRYEDEIKSIKDAQFGTVDIELSSGERYNNVSLKRLFPINNINNYISAVSSDGKEIFIIKDLSALTNESYNCALKCLNEYYMIPKIIKVLGKEDKFGRLNLDVETNIGQCTIEIANRNTDIKLRDNGRVLIRDINDNRYEIENVDSLDRKSLAILNSEL